MSQYWEADGTQLQNLVSEQFSADTLTLVFRATQTTAAADLRPLDSHSGEVSTHTRPDGSVTSTDLAGGSNTYTLTPPDARTNAGLMEARDWHVSEYRETALSGGDSAEVEIEFRPSSSRSVGSGFVDQARGADEWRIGTTNGAIATPSVVADPTTTVRNEIGAVELTVLCSPAQARVIAENCQRVAATRIRSVPDGENIPEDNTRSDANTIDVIPPQGGILPQGTYVISEWSVIWGSDDGHRLDATIWLADTTPVTGEWGGSEWGHIRYGRAP